MALKIGETQQDNLAVQKILSRLYLKDSRLDFPALQTYQHVIKRDADNALAQVNHLAELFLAEGRADEWALEVYLRSFNDKGDRQQLIKGIAAAVHWLKKSGRQTALLKNAEKLLKGIDPSVLEKVSQKFKAPVLPDDQMRDYARPLKKSLFQQLMSAAGAFFHLLGKAIAGVVSLFSFFLRLKKLKSLFKWAAALAITIGMAFFIVNTARYLTKTEQQDPPPKVTVQKTAPADLYTLQVAAYAKKELADLFVAKLKKKDIDLYVVRKKGKKRV